MNCLFKLKKSNYLLLAALSSLGLVGCGNSTNTVTTNIPPTFVAAVATSTSIESPTNQTNEGGLDLANGAPTYLFYNPVATPTFTPTVAAGTTVAPALYSVAVPVTLNAAGQATSAALTPDATPAGYFLVDLTGSTGDAGPNSVSELSSASPTDIRLNTAAIGMNAVGTACATAGNSICAATGKSGADTIGGMYWVKSGATFTTSPVIQKMSVTTTAGSAIATVASTATLALGMPVAGTGLTSVTIGDNKFGYGIQSIDSATQIHLNGNSTATGTNTLTFTGGITLSSSYGDGVDFAGVNVNGIGMNAAGTANATVTGVPTTSATVSTACTPTVALDTSANTSTSQALNNLKITVPSVSASCALVVNAPDLVSPHPNATPGMLLTNVPASYSAVTQSAASKGSSYNGALPTGTQNVVEMYFTPQEDGDHPRAVHWACGLFPVAAAAGSSVPTGSFVNATPTAAELFAGVDGSGNAMPGIVKDGCHNGANATTAKGNTALCIDSEGNLVDGSLPTGKSAGSVSTGSTTGNAGIETSWNGTAWVSTYGAGGNAWDDTDVWVDFTTDAYGQPYVANSAGDVPGDGVSYRAFCAYADGLTVSNASTTAQAMRTQVQGAPAGTAFSTANNIGNESFYGSIINGTVPQDITGATNLNTPGSSDAFQGAYKTNQMTPTN